MFKCKNSFSAGTLVHSEKGLVPIENVSIGDKVWAYNEEIGQRSLQEVIHRIQGVGTKELVDIELNSGEMITATADHPFYIYGEDILLGAGELTENHYLNSVLDTAIGIVSTAPYAKLETVYNLSVAHDHTYYVGEAGTLAHNCYQKPNWKPYQNNKHLPRRSQSIKEITESTQNGPAKYFNVRTEAELRAFELESWRKGIPVSNGKPWKVLEFPEPIGAKYGKQVRWMRLEYSEAGDMIHGHPITLEEFRTLLR